MESLLGPCSALLILVFEAQKAAEVLGKLFLLPFPIQKFLIKVYIFVCERYG